VKQAVVFWMAIAMLVAACAPGGQPLASSPGGQPAAQSLGPKRILAAVTADLPSARTQLARAAGGTLPGAREVEQLVHAGLAVEDEGGNFRPQLAEAVPTVENGLWKVFPDGRMETTWRIRPNAVWHDGTPFTAEDLVFTARIAQDRDIAIFGQLAYDAVEAVEAVDPRTVTVRWSQPFIEADAMFSGVGNVQPVPLPRHLLEQPYLENKANFVNLPYWNEGFVGAGPFKIREWAPGSHVIVEAFDRYILGRPKIDEIEIKFIADPTTLVANILAGAVELPIGRGLSFEQTLQVRDRWQEGKVEFSPGGAIKIWPQLHSPNPAVVGDARFRRAVYHGMDRQQLADTLMLGLTSVAHSVLIPTDREFAALDPAVVRYDYDPRRATQILEGMGLTRGPDGIFRDSAGQRVQVEMRATVIDVLQKTVLATADDWQRIGISVEPHTITPGRQSDREYRATFPAFDTSRGNNSVETFKTFFSSEARLPGNRYAGQNYPSYQNAELDAGINRFLVAIPMAERMEAGREVVRHLSDQVVVIPVFYDVVGTTTGNRLRNVPTTRGQNQTTTWNAHEWDVR
jgi:peptide/nickel transport system substrate-binding protein